MALADIEPEDAAWIIGLASGGFGDVMDMVMSNQAGLSAIETGAAVKARAAYTEAVDAWLDYVATIVENNPTRDFAQIIGRSDVQTLLSGVINVASNQVSEIVSDAWDQGGALGVAHAVAELKAMGLPTPDITPGVIQSGYLASVLGDMDLRATEAIGRILAAAEDGFDSVKLDVSDAGSLNVRQRFARQRAEALRAQSMREASKLSNSAAAGASVASNRAYSEAQIESYIGSQSALDAEGQGTRRIRKVWITAFRPTTCGTCASLHGTVVDIEVQFDHAQSFAPKAPKVYMDLQAPPRHPNCGCRLVPFVEGESGAIDPEAMRAYAKEWADTHEGMAPQTFPKQTPEFSSVSNDTAFMTSADVKAMSDGQFEASIDQFLQCVFFRFGGPS